MESIIKSDFSVSAIIRTGEIVENIWGEDVLTNDSES